MAAKLNVLLVDDHPVVRYGLRLLLETHARFSVCGQAEDVLFARRMAEELKPDFIILDLVLGGRDGIELIEDLLTLHGGAGILVYSSQDEMQYARRALRAGAKGYVAKTAGLEAVQAALERIAAGEIYVSDAVSRAMVGEYVRQPVAGSPLDLLSDRELQVFRMLGSGKGSTAIAEELSLSMKTVQTYRERLKNKLNIQSGRELERCAESFVQKGELPIGGHPAR